MEIAILMASGMGTRMRPLTEITPKPLIKVREKPMIETIIDALQERKVKKKKWKYKIVPLEGPFQMQEIHFVFINVNDDSTFFSVYHEFKEQVNPEVMENVKKKNRFLINMIKDTVERSNNK